MTAATAATLPPPLIVGCPKRWCIETGGCTAEDPRGGFFHYGRYSTVTDNFRRELDVVPGVYVDEDSVSAEPFIRVSVDDETEIEMSTGTAWVFSATLASFAAGRVPVGDTATFTSYVGDETLTLRRLSDDVFEYGNGAPHYMSFGAVEIVFAGPVGSEPSGKVGLSASTAEQFARFVAGAVREVSS